MKKRISFLTALLALSLPALSFADFRIAYSADGNQHDADDWHASPLALALIAEAGMKHRLVHFDYNNHLGDNDGYMASQHRQNVTGAIQRYGYAASRFFDDQRNLRGSINSIARAVNQSSAWNRLYLICAGPMEVCYRGIAAAQDARERYVTVVSHSYWNENHTHTGQMRHRWSDIKRDFAVHAVEIADQNKTAFRSSPGAWDWLKRQKHGSWLHQAVARGRNPGDASDAGMAFYVLEGRGKDDQWTNMGEIKQTFSSWTAGRTGDGRSGSGITPPNQFVSVKARNSNKCPQVDNWSGANGANVEQWSCAGNANQKWRFEKTWDGLYVLRARNSGKCIEVADRSWSNGGNITQWQCHHGKNQRFDLIPRGDGWFSLKSRHSSKCLSVADGSTRNGANINQWSCHGGQNQQFRFGSS